MPIEPFEIAFETSASLEEARSRVLTVLEERNGSVQVSSTQDIAATFGLGAKRRLWGGIFVNKNTLPRSMTISLRPVVEGTKVVISVRDSLGFGRRGGFGEKNRQVMLEDAVSIKSRFEDAR